MFDNVDPEQIGVTGVLNVGTLGEFIEIVIVAVLAHCPAVGVKVYVVVDVLLITGLQVPVMLFVELIGKEFIAVPEQTAATLVNVGNAGAVTVTVGDPLLAVPVTPPDDTDTIVYVEVVVGLTGILTGLALVAE